MKKFFSILLSDSNRFSVKRFIGLLCLLMFMAYGIVALFKPFVLEFWIFYVSLCVITIWIGFKFMSAEKILKYNVIESLSRFGTIKKGVDSFIDTENQLDSQIQPSLTGNTTTTIPPDQQQE